MNKLQRSPDDAPAPRAAEASALERPLPAGVNAAAFGSDVVAETLRALDIPFVALNPGSSFRGLHDSLVNYLGNRSPQLLLCLHEEAAVAIAHGYAKVTGRAMAVAVHANVGLFHATMAMFNAWCDRMPMLVLGATGPLDASKRRPWIDWIHTARDQAAIVRGYVKWDDQPASPAAAREAVMRACWLANTAPKGPTYVVLDAEMQEAKLAAALPPVDAARFVPPVAGAVPDDVLRRTVDALRSARRPLMLVGRVSRDPDAWNARVAIAESLNARVVTDLKAGAGFPTDHPLHVDAPAILLPGAAAQEAIRAADVVLSFDWIDLAGTLSAAGAPAPGATVIQVSLDHHLHNGWSMDHQGLPPVDLFVATDPDIAAYALCEALGAEARPQAAGPASVPPLVQGPLGVEHLARALRQAGGARDVSLTHLPLSWHGAWWPFRHPLDFLGGAGGGGIGGGPGISVGAALALKGSGRLPVAICGDGDYLMGATALWTAAHYRIPLLLVVANNRSFFNDELHQERVARLRGRPVENRWIGQRISDPDIDLAGLARAQGAVAFGPVERAADLPAVFETAIAAVEGGAVAVVDVHVEPGYGPAMSAATVRGHNPAAAAARG